MARDLTAEQVAALTALVDRQAAARERFSVNLVTYIKRLLRTLFRDGFYDEVAVARFAREVSTTVRSGQVSTADLTGAYLDQVLDVLGVDRDSRGRPVALPEQLRGIDPAEEWQRPAEQFRYQVSEGLAGLDALARAEERAEALARDDLALAMREAARQKLAPVNRVTGYRRVIHPELSTSGTCGLCIAASDRAYRKAELLPIHDRCKCEVVPIIEGLADPGRVVNDEDLADLYRQALEASGGDTSRAALKRVRFVVVQHGELGPILRVAGQRYRGPGDVADDSIRAA